MSGSGAPSKRKKLVARPLLANSSRNVEGAGNRTSRVATRESAMAKKQGGSKPKAQSALGPIAHALIEGYLGPDQQITNMERFFTALMQALHDAYALGWKDRGEIERAK